MRRNPEAGYRGRESSRREWKLSSHSNRAGVRFYKRSVAECAYVVVDASGTFSETKRQVGLLRMLQAGVVYGAIDMAWAKLVGQIARAHGN